MEPLSPCLAWLIEHAGGAPELVAQRSECSAIELSVRTLERQQRENQVSYTFGAVVKSQRKADHNLQRRLQPGLVLGIVMESTGQKQEEDWESS